MNPSRRAALALLAGTCWPVAAQPVRRIGVLAPSTAARESVTLKPFFDQMAQLAWVEGNTVRYDRSYADDLYHELPRLARELVARRPELIFAPPAPAAVAAKAATSSLPIVFATGTDPVGTGLVAGLARPGGNVTGLCSVIDSLAPKSLELLQQIAPGVRRIGLLGDRDDSRLQQDRDALAPLLAARGMQLVVGEATHPKAFDEAVAMLLRERVEAVMTNSSLSFNLRHRLVELLQGQRVAVIGHRSEMVDAGGLFSYGAVLGDQIRRAALVVDKILRGARPADIPVEQPTLFEFALNRKTAQALGITLSQPLLLRADRVVE
jgi:putative ABC transport system substrate-binding protein